MTSDNAKKSPVAKFAGFAFTVIITVVFFILAFTNVDFSKVWGLISQSSWQFIFLYILIFMFSHFARAIRWKYILHSVKENTSTLNLMSAVMVSYAISNIIPRLGELYRALFLGKWENISRPTVFGTIVVERIIDLITFAIAALVSVLIYNGNLYQDVAWLRTSLIIGIPLILALSLILIILVRNKNNISGLLINFIGRFSKTFASKVDSFLHTLIEGFATIKSTRIIFRIIVWTVLVFAAYVINTMVGFYLFDMQLKEGITFGTAWIVLSISSFGVLIPTPGGLGSYHAITIAALTQLYGFSFEVSAAFAILTHFISYFGFILSGIIFLLVVNRKRAKEGLPRETLLSVFKNRLEQ